MAPIKQHLKLLLLLAVCLLLTSCKPGARQLNGYIEAQLTYIASPLSGRLTDLYIQRGSAVVTGDKLFTLEQMPQESDVIAAQQGLAQAKAKLADLQKGQRPSEIEAIVAQIEQSKANIDFFDKQLARRVELYKKSAIQKELLDRAKLDRDESHKQLKQLQANLDTAKLGSRYDLIRAAQNQVEIAQAQVQKTQWAAQQKQISTPKSATVFDTYYRQGELVPANHPVVSLLSAEDIKVVFFIPEPSLSEIKLNQKILLNCTECVENLTAKISFISPVAEFTPPIIYSNSARSKLVFRVEGSLDPKSQSKIHPGQPVDIIINQS